MIRPGVGVGVAVGVGVGVGEGVAGGLALPDRRFRLSAVFGLCLGDVRIWARDGAVVGPYLDDVRIGHLPLYARTR